MCGGVDLSVIVTYVFNLYVMFRDIIKEFVEMIQSVKCLLHTHANEFTRKLSVMVHACNLGTGEAE